MTTPAPTSEEDPTPAPLVPEAPTPEGQAAEIQAVDAADPEQPPPAAPRVAKEPPLYDTGPEFQAFLLEIGQTKHGFARTLKRLGDHREKDNIHRVIMRIASGEFKISPEMRVIMTIMRNSHRKRMAAAAAAASGTTPPKKGKAKPPREAAATP